ncbi:MAG: DUF4835 family protein [Vicingaceae bacterium]
MKYLFGIFFLISLSVSSQELNCVVSINAKQIQGTETRIYETLEKAIFNFMNNTKWTQDIFDIDERIECSVFITLNERDGANFKGTIQISSRRPVYNSSYYSSLFNHLDQELAFNYLEYSQLDFNINSHINNLTSILAFYAYIFIGLDYDTFSKQGGADYFDQALKIVNNAQAVNYEGWKAFESDRNRYWLAQSLNDDFYNSLHECLYEYHLKGLDIMWKETDAGRAIVATSLKKLEKIHQARPSSFIMKVFFNAKADECVNIFKEGLPAEKNDMAALLTTLDPGNAQKYDKIQQQ